MATTWYSLSSEGDVFRLTFQPTWHRFWLPSVVGECPLPAAGVAGRRVVLTGPGAVGMYAHAAAFLRAQGGESLHVELPSQPSDSDDLHGGESVLISVGRSQKVQLC